MSTKSPLSSHTERLTLSSPFLDQELRFNSDKKCIQNLTDGGKDQSEGWTTGLSGSTHILSKYFLSACHVPGMTGFQYTLSKTLFQARVPRGWHRALKPVLCPLPGSQTASLLHLLQAPLPSEISAPSWDLQQCHSATPSTTMLWQGFSEPRPITAGTTLDSSHEWELENLPSTCYPTHTHISNTPSQVYSTITLANLTKVCGVPQGQAGVHDYVRSEYKIRSDRPVSKVQSQVHKTQRPWNIQLTDNTTAITPIIRQGGWRIKIKICLGDPRVITHAESGIWTWPKRLFRFLQAEIRKECQ